MTASVVKELYNSPNGDRWLLCRDPSGKLIVSHHPNSASGGRVSEIAADDFLARSGGGPEHRALVEALAGLRTPANGQGNHGLSAAATAELSRALGQAVARCWSSLPQKIQHDLFEAAVRAEGEKVRQQLAVYLHGKHDRTVDGVLARAMPEPDSLGG